MNMGSQIIFREEASEIKKLKGWILIYGRRKVGKTFLIKNFLNYNVYFRVRRDGKIKAEKFILEEINKTEDFLKALSELLGKNKTVVIDEFQRLPEFALEEIATVHPKGKIIFSGSSMRVVKKLFGNKSPLLGLAMQYPLSLIRAKNILRELSKKFDAVYAIELSPYLKDPWTIPFFKKEETVRVIYTLLQHSKITIPALIGEIFIEEERELTKVYESIIRAIGAGEWNYKNIAAMLANRKIIGGAESSLVLPYIKNLVEMGIIEPLQIYKKKKFYKLVSSIMEAFYYLADRYDFEEREVSFEEAKPTIEKLRNLAIQNFIADLFAELYDGRKEYFISPQREIDFIITKRNKIEVIGEVKWKKIEKADLEKFRKNSEFLKGRKILICKEGYIKDKEIEVINAKKLVEIVCKKQK